MNNEYNFIAAPGEFIQEWMEETGINQAELARRLGVSRKHVNQLLTGKAALTPATALALERVTGVPSRIWNRYETGYRDALLREEQRKQAINSYATAKSFPLAHLRKIGVITANARDKAATVSQLLSFLGVANFSAFSASWSESSMAYRRRAASRKAELPTLASWLLLGEKQISDNLPTTNKTEVKALLPQLRKLTCSDIHKALPEARRCLREVGVALCIVPAIKGLGVHGVTRWVNDSPVIQLSTLYKTDDQIWFTLFHELGHVLLHSDTELFISDDDSQAEKEADAFAAQTLIPEPYQKSLPRKRDLKLVKEMAEEIGVAPSIILGQAQHQTGDYAWGHALKQKINWNELTDFQLQNA